MIGAQLPDEEILGKAYDARLMARILRYLRPYWKQLAVAFVFLLLQPARSYSVPISPRLPSTGMSPREIFTASI